MRRLGVYAVDNNIPNLRLDREQFSVEIRGKGGLCLKHLHHEGIGVRRVIIGQLLCRLPYAACSNFNGSVFEINRVLREMTSGLKGIVFWPHLGFGNSLSYLGPDGVHIQCTYTVHII